MAKSRIKIITIDEVRAMMFDAQILSEFNPIITLMSGTPKRGEFTFVIWLRGDNNPQDTVYGGVTPSPDWQAKYVATGGRGWSIEDIISFLKTVHEIKMVWSGDTDVSANAG